MIEGQITYTPEIDKSKLLMEESKKSFDMYSGWDITPNKGLTKNTWNTTPFDYNLIPNGRLDSMTKSNDGVLKTKLACVYNNVLFWHTVIEHNRSMVFIEHDIICESNYLEYEFDEYLILNIEDAVRGNPKLNKNFIFNINEDGQQIEKLVDWTKHHNELKTLAEGIHNLTDLKEYPLIYYKNNRWASNMMVPGTACYALSPKGAEKLIHAAKIYGLDQSDFIINSATVNIEYVLPSPVRFNTTYINTSHIK